MCKILHVPGNGFGQKPRNMPDAGIQQQGMQKQMDLRQGSSPNTGLQEKLSANHFTPGRKFSNYEVEKAIGHCCGLNTTVTKIYMFKINGLTHLFN